MSNAINVFLPGHADPCDSYGLIACELTRHLTGLGAYVNLMTLGERRHLNQSEDVAALAAQPFRPVAGGILLGWPITYGAHNALAHVGPRVAVTMFESSKLPADWADILNTLDAVIVPSTFCVDVFKQSGVTVPIHRAPLGVGDIYQPYRRSLRRRLTFMAFLDRGKRKGGLAAQQAFSLAFGDDPDYHLILKMRQPKVEHRLLNENMTMIQRDLSEPALYELYKTADVLINPNAGEGFGLLPREFACTGGVSLTTNWGGTADDIDEWGWPLPYRLVQADWAGAKTLEGQDLGVWAEPDIEAMAQVLTTVADKRQYYLPYAEQAALDVRARYSWRSFAKQVLDVYQGVLYGNRNGL